jgi:hypothetical protein
LKNIDNIILKTSKDLDVPKEKVKLLVDGYWNEVYDRLLSLDTTTVYIRNVGLITISRYKLRKFIFRLIQKIRITRTTDKFSEADKKEIEARQIKKLQKALIQRNIIAKYNLK